MISCYALRVGFEEWGTYTSLEQACPANSTDCVTQFTDSCCFRGSKQLIINLSNYIPLFFIFFFVRLDYKYISDEMHYVVLGTKCPSTRSLGGWAGGAQ